VTSAGPDHSGNDLVWICAGRPACGDCPGISPRGEGRVHVDRIEKRKSRSRRRSPADVGHAGPSNNHRLSTKRGNAKSMLSFQATRSMINTRRFKDNIPPTPRRPPHPLTPGVVSEPPHCPTCPLLNAQPSRLQPPSVWAKIL